MENYLKKVVIKDLFDEGNNYEIDLIEGCNCIFGDNGTGKTSIINLIVSTITVDIDKLAKIPFKSISIYLAKSGQVRARRFLTVEKFITTDSLNASERQLKYVLHNDAITLTVNSSRLIDNFDEQRRGQVESITSNIKSLINKEISLTHVPLLRVQDSEIFGGVEQDDYLHMALKRRQFSQKQILEIMDPSLRVISSIQSQFIEEVNERRKKITVSLENLKSKIIEKVMIDNKIVNETSKAFQHISKAISSTAPEIDAGVYFKKLKEANIDVPESKVHEHFNVWKDLSNKCKEEWSAFLKLEKSGCEKKELEKSKSKFDASYFSLFSITHFYDRFLNIVSDVEKMQGEKSQILKIFTDYEHEINTYLSPNKKFHITEDGRFRVFSGTRQINLADLSSGEKHIITILGRAALSTNIGSIFVADEPELSLHLDWQRKILPSIQKLSPLSQVIVATHSPAISAKGGAEIDLSECK
ncbi:AAA family ATPase [Serratia marcescens]|uniref:AAA family ATPase n=1 Tax=Serratia marcescens TaxID=615 RepID=UPI0021BDA70A|nr:AAA family ATPase [Serratia marcescens]